MILIISTCSDQLSELEFVKPLEDLIGSKAKHYATLTPDDIAKADKIIIAGTALKDFKYLQHDFSWLKECEKPVLGICAGMQALAQAHGVELEDFTAIGPQPVEVRAENKLAEGSFSAYFLHTKTGTGSFKVLATTNNKPCMIKHPEKEQYGCIFHPEVLNTDILTNFMK